MANPAWRYPPLVGIVFLAAFMPAHDADARTFFCTGGRRPVSDSVDQRREYERASQEHDPVGRRHVHPDQC